MMRLPDLMGVGEKRLVVLPIVVVLAAAAVLGYGYVSTGSPVDLGMDFQGGVAVTVNTDAPADRVASDLGEFGVVETRRMPEGVMAQFGPMSDSERGALEEAVSESYGSYQITTVSEVFGSELQTQALTATLVAFLAMAGMVLILFRRAVPAGTIAMIAFFDILVAAGFMRLTGLQLSLGTVAALLMLIGYAVDSNILLTSRMLRRRGSISTRFNSAFRTGATMAVTTLSAMAVLAAVSYFGGMRVIFEITAVLFAGLVADFLNTWLLNGSVLRTLLRSEGVEVR